MTDPITPRLAACYTGVVHDVMRAMGLRDFTLPPELSRFVAEKGSICLDGVSLTVNGVDADGFDVALIPHTMAVTTFGSRRVGDRVNVEIDLVARYLDRLLAARRGTP